LNFASCGTIAQQYEKLLIYAFKFTLSFIESSHGALVL
jgi:hypothetical protein